MLKVVRLATTGLALSGLACAWTMPTLADEPPAAKPGERSLAEQYADFQRQFRANVPETTRKLMTEATETLRASGLAKGIPQVEAMAPALRLPDAKGQTTDLADLLKAGPVVVVWYRGGWCPYCNMELAAYRERLGELRAAGASLVAVSPQLPDGSMSTAEKNKLEFPVLSDVGNKAAREWGLVFKLSEPLLKTYRGFGIELDKANGPTAAEELPLAATFVIAPDGRLVFAHADADYTVRAEPAEVISVVGKLKTTQAQKAAKP